jgi:hypothetical protein
MRKIAIVILIVLSFALVACGGRGWGGHHNGGSYNDSGYNRR